MLNSQISLNSKQSAMLAGKHGRTKAMAMRLVLDLAAAAGSSTLIPIECAHLSGVSPLTGGLGLRQFLARLATDEQAKVAVPTTLNSAGCDMTQFDAMRITAPDFLAHNREIVELYTQLGVRPTQSCIPYEWDGVVTEGVAAWAESNAICFANSYCGMRTNRESGLSALAAALTGYTPAYGLLDADNVQPNLKVNVTVTLDEPSDFSLLGDWIGAQRSAAWQMPLGPMPLISGLPETLTHDQRKALTAEAANYGCPLLFIEGDGNIPSGNFQDTLLFDENALASRYQALSPTTQPSLITIGCPQASIGELRAVAQLLRNKRVHAAPNDAGIPPLWIFTSSANRDIAAKTGVKQLIESAGALLLADTCPEVVPYDRQWVRHILTNSMKAEHYIKSGLNGIPTSVMTLPDCVDFATGVQRIQTVALPVEQKKKRPPSVVDDKSTRFSADFQATGTGLPSQSDFVVEGEAFVTAAPITLLGFVNRETGVIEEPGHPADGQSMDGKIAIFPKGSGSTVAPYVLLELFYRGRAPIAIVNTDIDQQCAPACSLENIPYGYGFGSDIVQAIKSGDKVRLERRGDDVTVTKL